MGRLSVLKTLCNERGISINKLEQELGFSQGSLTKIDTNVPKADKVFLIAQYFGVPMEIFFESDEEKVEAMLYEAMHKEYSVEHHETVRIPVFECAAGQGRINGDYANEYISVGETEEGYEWVRIYGDSMYPLLHDGDMAKVELGAEVTHQDIAIVKVDGERVTAKHVEIASDGVWLKAENKEVFADCFFTIAEVITLPVVIVGKVVMFQRNL